MLMLLIGKPINKRKIQILQSGFSMLELLVVMAIIGMAAALVIPRLGSSEVTILKAQVREAVAVLRYARRSAIVEGKQKVANFSQGKKAENADNQAVYKIIFYPEGGSSGGEIILKHLEHKAKISVNPITGKIESEILHE